MTDKGGAKTDATITLSETNVDEAASFDNQTHSYAENQEAGATVATLTASDVDGVEGFAFKLGEDSYSTTSADGFFEIDNHGNITITAAGVAAGVNDFEANPNGGQYVVTMTDKGGAKTDATVTLSETNVDEAASFDNQTHSYAENQEAGATVATLTASDIDGVEGFAFKLGEDSYGSTSADGFFQIDNNGNITITAAGVAAGVNDFETAPNSGQYVVTMTDKGGAKTDATVTLAETNVDEAASFDNQTHNYAENQEAGATVATLTASDVDGVEGFAFKLGEDSYGSTSADGFFQVDNAGNITITAAGVAAGVNDFEANPNGGQYVVTMSDKSGAKTDATVTLSETNVDEADSFDNQTHNYAENQEAGATVATLTASDVDGVQGFAFKLGEESYGSTSADGFFQIDNAGNITITAAGVAAGVNDFETAPNSGQYVVTMTDKGGAKTDATVTLAETNVDEAASFDNQTHNYAENQTAGATVATLTASDVDGVQGFAFKLGEDSYGSTSADGFFQIDNNGNITITAAGVAAGVNDFETAPNSGQYVVTMTDKGGAKTDATVTLAETNVDEAASFDNQTHSYAENQEAGATVATLTASDIDGVEGFAFKLGEDSYGGISADGFFQIDNNGNITITAAGVAAGRQRF